MGSFRDLVRQVNEEKKTVPANQQEQSSKGEEEKEKKSSSSFKDLVRRVNDGTVNVGSKLNGTEVADWYSRVRDISDRASEYLTSDRYRTPDTRIMDEIDRYLSEAPDIGQYIRANRSGFNNYDETIQSYHDVVRYLRDIQSGVKASNDFYSMFDTEDDYNNWMAEQEMHSADLDALQKEIDELKGKRAQLASSGTSSQSATSYLTGGSALQTDPYAYGPQAREGSNGKGIRGLEALISQKEQYLNRAKYLQEGDALSVVSQSADFGKYSVYDDQNSDVTYAYINGADNGVRAEVAEKAQTAVPATTYLTGGSTLQTNPYAYGLQAQGDAATDLYVYNNLKIYDYMREDEIAIYNYHYAKDGKEAAERYLHTITEQLNARKAQDMFKDMKGHTWQEMLFGIAAGLDQADSGMTNLFNTEDDYIPMTAYQIASGMVREDLADDGFKLPDWMGGASIAQVGYDTVTTTANMLPSVLTSTVVGMINPTAGAAVGTGMMGMSAAGNAYQEMLNQGYSKGQARMYSTLVGASEAGLEYLLGGISKLGGKVSGGFVTKMANGVDNALGRFAIKWGGSMISEGLEEGLQEVLTPMFQNAVMHTDEDINWSEVFYSGLLGAVTAGFMEGPGVITGEVNTYRTGKRLQAADISAARLAEIGSTFAADTVAHQLAGRVNENTGAYTMGRLFNEIGATLTQQNVNDITQALVKEGLPESMAKKKAKLMAMIVDGVAKGENLSDDFIRVVEDDTLLAKAVRTTIIDPNATWFQRSKGYNEALMALAQEKAAPKASRTNPAEAGQENAPTSDKVDTVTEVGSEGISEVDTSPAKVSRITSIKDGNVTIKLEDGSEVNAVDADLDPEDGVIIETIAKVGGISAQDANYILGMVKANPGTNSQWAALGATEAYRYGFYGMSQEYMAEHGVFAQELSEDQRSAIYETGRKAGKTQVEAKQASVSKKETVATTEKSSATGKVHFEGDRSSLTERQSASLPAMEKLADILGVQIHVFESKVGKNGKRIGENGRYDPRDNSIHIDLHAGQNGEGTMLFTLAHELTHHIRKWSPAKFKVLADFLMEEYGKQGVNVDGLIREQMTKAKRGGRTISYDTAYEEMVADSMETMLADGDVIKKLAKLKARDQGLWQKIKDFINELATKIRNVYKGLKPDSVEGRYVADMGKAVYRLQELFAEALVDASENYQSTEKNTTQEGGEAQYSLRDVKVPTRTELEKKDPIKVIDISAAQTKGTFAERRREIWKRVDEVISKPYFNKDTKTWIFLTKDSYTHSFSNSGTIQLNAAEHFPELIENAVLTHAELPTHGSDYTDGVYTFFAAARAKQIMPVKLKVKEYNYVGQLLPKNIRDYFDSNPRDYAASYDTVVLEVEEIEKSPSGSVRDIMENDVAPDPEELSTIKVADLLSLVNGKYEKYVPKFSDRDYSYDALVNKPDMAVTEVGGKVPKNRADVAQMAKQNAATVGKFDPKTGSVSVYVEDIGTDVILSTKGLRHGLRRTQDPLNVPNYIVTVKAGEILKNSIRINEITPSDVNAKSSYVLMGAAKDVNGTYVVRFVVNHFDNSITAMDVLYAINAKKEPAALNAPRLTAKPLSVTGSKISIAELLDLVNQHFPDILPEEVLKHYGYDARPEGMLGEDALYSDRDTESVSNRSLLADALESVAQTDWEKQKLTEYKSQIQKIEAQEKKLRELNQQIRELSFAQGPRDKAKLSALRDEATKSANRINILDKQLLRLEASKPLQAVLEREKKKAYRRAEQKGKAALAEYREKAAKDQREMLERWQDSRKRNVEGRKKTEIRHKIQHVVAELNDLLLTNDKKRHVPDSLKKAVADALALVNMDTVGAEERAAKYAKLIAEEQAKADPNQDKIDAYTVTMENILRQGEKMGQRLKELHDAYEEIQQSDDPDIALAYDSVIAGSLKELSQTIGNTSLRDMTIEQLSDVYDMYRMVLTRVRDANKSFLNEKKESISALAARVVGEVRRVGGEHKQRAVILDPVRKFLWNNLKPVYAFEQLGSATLRDAFNGVRKGEDTWAVDVTEARGYYLDKSKKYGYDTWDFRKKHRFESTSGIEFELTLEQILSLYAYSKREQAHDHLRLGGFVFDSNIETYKDGKSKLIKYKVNTADAHQITPEILGDIIGKLTAEQKAFVDEMQDYLSTTMGAKGNEVTMQMYGVKLFKEKNYFPLKSAKQFMFQQNEVSGEVRIKYSGFTNKTVPKANNPIILQNFMDVWAGHVNDMSMYHAFVLPLEDFNRIFNYSSPKREGQPAVSVEGTIQNAYSPAAVSYVKNLITDLNGGARTDSTTGFINKMMGLFKKGSVFASLSVVVQQPSAIARAAALMDAKYFIGPKVDPKRHKALWEEVKKYAPVAIIKEMGYFDTNMGKSTQDFILSKEYSGFGEKLKALVTDSGYRDEILSKAPALADELAWCSIWEAVKREMHDKHPGLDVKSEPFLMLAGTRFTEVITKTQVYDSVLSRSANMRSKDTGMKMATAFMAEPTTSINMIADALLQGKRGNRKYARAAIGAVIASQIFNSILVSFVYAGRDDDEDKSYWEKYLGNLTGETIDSLNPMTYIPFIKDMVSIVQGYDVERSDMAVISDLWNAWQKLDKENVSVWRKVEGFAGSVAQIFGLPVKNIMRDARGIYQTVDSFISGQQTTKAGIGYAVKESLPSWMGGGDTSNQDQLYEAYISDDRSQIERVEGRYKDQSAINSAMRSAIKERFLSGDLSREDAHSYLVTFAGLEDDEAYWKLEEWGYEGETGEDFAKYNDFFAAVQTGRNLRAVINEYTENGVADSTLKSQLSGHFKPLYMEMSRSERANIKGYLLNAMTVLGDSREDAERTIAKWEYAADHPELAERISYSDFKRWEAEGKPNGVSVELYTDVYEYRDNGSETRSQEEVAAYIHSLPISTAQKDALWCCFWKESTLKNAPWH